MSVIIADWRVLRIARAMVLRLVGSIQYGEVCIEINKGLYVSTVSRSTREAPVATSTHVILNLEDVNCSIARFQ